MQLAVYMNLLQTERTLDVVGVIDDPTEYFQIVSEGTNDTYLHIFNYNCCFV